MEIPFQHLRLPMVSRMTGLGQSTIWRMVKQERFPRPVKLSERITAWRADDVKAWLASKTPNQQKDSVHAEETNALVA